VEDANRVLQRVYGHAAISACPASDRGAGKRNAPIHGYCDAHDIVAGARGKIDRDPGHVLIGANAPSRDADRKLVGVITGAMFRKIATRS